jgi:hypothetical protein
MLLKLSIWKLGYLMQDTNAEEKEWEITSKELEDLKNWFLKIYINEDWTLKKELDEVMMEKEKEEQRQENIRKDIAEAIIDFKWWKFKIRKKDIGVLAWQFLLCDKTQTDPITVQDSEYNSIDLTVQEFWQLARLVELKREEIANKY